MVPGVWRARAAMVGMIGVSTCLILEASGLMVLPGYLRWTEA
jgi:hypothetical protein